MIEIIKKYFELEDHGIIYLNGKINPEMYEYVSREIIKHNCKGKQKFIQMIRGSISVGVLKFFHKKRVPISGDPLTTEDTPIQKL